MAVLPDEQRPAGSGPTASAAGPIWLCRVCAAEWPCPTARTLLPVEHQADPLTLHVC
ncbi:hypothetical protein [Plantactinospora sp. KLBMP9567]|uniref:hypothetical protein n=1 Tax=Plantactinospora sp. KLBMP9567 TaxID=3085900 RepID=UPI002981197B|nr:hypothetical protein [Plantactinospora sp. KLBMP9567]MDW5327911.1 hypothetical protein [Plantactinospora sp. KLBMP9567]